MKNAARNDKSTMKPAQPKLEAPIVLTPDQIAMVAAGAALSLHHGPTTTSGARLQNIAYNTSIKGVRGA